MIKKIWYKIKSIKIIGETYEKLIGNKKVKYIQKSHKNDIKINGKRYISLVENALKDSGAIYYVCSGTLLGLIREGKFIDWDFDIDYAVVMTDDFTFNELEKILVSNGFKKTREFKLDGELTEQSYAIGKLNIDFFAHFREENYMRDYFYVYIEGETYENPNQRTPYIRILPLVNEIKKIKFDDVEVSVPSNSEELLEAMYNEDWFVPNPNWKIGDGKKSKIIKGKFGECKEY